MTNKEAIEQLKRYFECDDGTAAEPITKQAYKMAIEALKQSEQKKARWIEWTNLVLHTYLFDKHTFFRCSSCTRSVKRKTKYCPNCGAKMDKEEE